MQYRHTNSQVAKLRMTLGHRHINNQLANRKTLIIKSAGKETTGQTVILIVNCQAVKKNERYTDTKQSSDKQKERQQDKQSH